MIVNINNRIVILTSHTSVSQLASRYGITHQGNFIAINGKIVGQNHWETTYIEDGDNIEIIKS